MTFDILAEVTGELGALDMILGRSSREVEEGTVGRIADELELPGRDFSGFFLPNENDFLFRRPNVFELLRLMVDPSVARPSRLRRRSRSCGSVSDSSVSETTTAGLSDV
jgi:hypothetical protein